MLHLFKATPNNKEARKGFFSRAENGFQDARWQNVEQEAKVPLGYCFGGSLEDMECWNTRITRNDRKIINVQKIKVNWYR